MNNNDKLLRELQGITIEYKVEQLLMGFLKAHQEMIEHPGGWSLDNAATSQFYGLRNRIWLLLGEALKAREEADGEPLDTEA